MNRAILCVRCDDHPATRIWSEQAVCDACFHYYDNYEPGDPDGEEMFRDRVAEARDACVAARRLK